MEVHKEKVLHRSAFAMGTRLDAIICDVNPEKGRLIFDELTGITGNLERKISIYNSDSEISMINQSRRNHQIHIDEEVFEILKMCRSFQEKTKGFFNITLGKYIQKIKNNEDFELSSNNLNWPSFSDVFLSDDHKSVTRLKEEVKFDLGGVGKGFALGKIEELFKDYGVLNAFVSFGESSLLAMGHHPHGDCWKIGVPNKYNPKESLFILELSDQFVSISGSLRIVSSNTTQSATHVLNPLTRKSTDSDRLTVIVSHNPAEAEVLSTSLLICQDDAIWEEISGNFNNFEAYEVKFEQNSANSRKIN